MSEADRAVLVDEAELKGQTFGDAELLREIVALFAQQTPQLLVALEAVGGAGRSEIAHRLKGSALALGAKALAETAARIERAPDDATLVVEAVAITRETIGVLQGIARGAA